jgi:hypothetical protein
MTAKTVMETKDWTPERRELAASACKFLRDRGHTYERMVSELSWLPDEYPKLPAWEVYALANPGKSAAQVDAWRRKHCPAADAAATQGNL